MHLLLTDVRMREMSGPEVARRIREVRPGVRVLYMTGHGGDALAGAPVDPRDILECSSSVEAGSICFQLPRHMPSARFPAG